MRENDAEEIGAHVDDGSHQQTAGAASLDCDAGGIAVAVAQQELDGLDEVGEGGALGHHLAGIVPGVAQLPATADVGIGHDQAAVQQRQTRRAEAQGKRITVGAVAVDIKRRRAIVTELVAAIHQRNRNLHPVAGFEPQAGRLIVGSLETAGNLLLFE